MRGFAHDQTRPSDSCYEATNEVSLKSIHIYLRYRTETSVTDRRTDGQGVRTLCSCRWHSKSKYLILILYLILTGKLSQ